jgi:serine protease Do
MKKTLYQVLGVEPGATVEEITAAHDKAMTALDSGSHDRNDWIMVREAFAVLSNTNKRAMYDMSLATPSSLRSQARAIADMDDQPAGRPWLKYVIGGVLVLGVLLFIRSRAPTVAAPAKAGGTATVMLQVPEPSSGAAPVGQRVAAPAVSGPALSGEQLYAKLSPSVASVGAYGNDGVKVGGGSGVAIAPESLITNCHVAKLAPKLKVKIAGNTFDASITIADEEHDLCQLYVQGMNVPAVPLGSSSAVQAGQRVLALGSPYGLDLTMSDGIVSSLRPVEGGTVIQTTAPVSPGSSGGGLFDTSGKLVGIVTFQMVNGQNLNFAAPVDWIGVMRTRPVGDGFIRKVASANSDEDAKSGPPPATQVVGNWHCHESIGGRSLTLDFRSNQSLVMRIAERGATGRWYFDGNQLSLSFSDWNGSLKVQSWNSSKIILDYGDGERLVCARQ